LADRGEGVRKKELMSKKNHSALDVGSKLDSRFRGNGIKLAVQSLQRGGIVVYPTDTAYGLAVDATNGRAVRKLYQLKGRQFKKPIHVICPINRSISEIVDLNPVARKLMKKFWPGPLTIILPLRAKGKSWQMLSAGMGTLGVRSPDNLIAQMLYKALGRPITTTSANVSGKPNCYAVSAVKRQFAKSKQKPDYYLDGGQLRFNRPSTVVSTINHVKILREGPISLKQINQALK
jgi:L-threonylcarbamoyladenylate synthase